MTDSIVGPLLFVVYINDLPSNVLHLVQLTLVNLL